VTDEDSLFFKLVRVVKAPLMIDTTDARVMEHALTWCQGKSILNSINLEDGLARFEKVVPLGRRFGAAYVVGLIDEQGMAVTVARKLEVARRSYRILTEEMGVAPEDIWWDPLVFPCGTGDEAYLGSASATIEGVRAVKAEFPLTKLFVRAFDRGHSLRLIQAGVDYHIRETFESALTFGREVLVDLGFAPEVADETIEDVRRRDAERLTLQLAGGLTAGRSLMRGNAVTPQPAPYLKPKREGQVLNEDEVEAAEA